MNQKEFELAQRKYFHDLAVLGGKARKGVTNINNRRAKKLVYEYVDSISHLPRKTWGILCYEMLKEAGEGHVTSRTVNTWVKEWEVLNEEPREHVFLDADARVYCIDQKGKHIMRDVSIWVFKDASYDQIEEGFKKWVKERGLRLRRMEGLSLTRWTDDGPVEVEIPR